MSKHAKGRANRKELSGFSVRVPLEVAIQVGVVVEAMYMAGAPMSVQDVMEALLELGGPVTPADALIGVAAALEYGSICYEDGAIHPVKRGEHAPH